MNVNSALSSPVFQLFSATAGTLMLVAGAALGTLKLFGRHVDHALESYKSWLIMVPLILLTMLLGRVAVIVAVMLLAAFGFREFARATGLYRDWLYTGSVLAGIVALGAATFVPDPRLGSPGWYGLYMAMPVFVIAAILLAPVLKNRSDGQLQRMALAIFAFVYFGWMFMHLGFLANSTHAYAYLLFLLLAVEANDIAAYISGKLFGHRPLRRAISPNKTVEGGLGALAVSLALPWLFWPALPNFTWAQLVLIGVVVGVGGQLGDLIISTIKRDIGVKDMGTAIRGHGGILDRIDSLIFVAPLFFHTVRWFHGL
ncbi:MAG: phosphatidate cytidylyltransferase [Woeseiaceae bacterium]|nr:phosphatidate cytidylyltransferase [Woeseiaceae bacterium]